MTARSLGSTVLFLAIAVYTFPAVAQTNCTDSVVLKRGHFDWSGYYERGPVTRLSDVAWQWVQRAHPSPLGGDDLQGVYDSVFTSLRVRYSDTAIAQGLAVVMSGGSHGFSEDVGFAAAGLYLAWHVPSQPAMTVFADPYLSATSRLAALIALRPAWSDPRVRPLVIAALCDLAAASTAFAPMRSGPRNPDRDFLPDDQFELLVRVMDAARQSAGATSAKPSSIIPATSPLAGYLARWGL